MTLDLRVGDEWRFQFLLVRLKDGRGVVKWRGKRISIPSGTIKSNENNEVAVIINTFQFLLVRLKAYGGKKRN